MSAFATTLGTLLRRDTFRQLLEVRIANQTGDGLVQVGMLAYALFSPQHQPNAWAIAGVLAVQYLPFSFVGPFVSTLLDRWPRQRISVFVDCLRALLCVVIAVCVWNNDAGDTAIDVIIYGLLLVTLSLNRFVLAGLAAGMPLTVKDDEYLEASSIIPILGPLGLVVAGIGAGAVRVFLSDSLGINVADSIIFMIGAVVFALAALLMMRIRRYELGPTPDEMSNAESLGNAWVGLVDALKYLGRKPLVMQGLGAIAVERAAYGLLMTTTILTYRNYFHATADVNGAIADMGVWFIASGIGYALSSVAAPIVARHFGVRLGMTIMLAAAAVFQVLPGSIFTRPTLVAASFLLGVCFQSIKVYTDTYTQTHIADAYRGRVFMLYDIINNNMLVAGALVAALFAPLEGFSLPIYLGLAGALAVESAFFAFTSREK
ncbi:MAG: MFS transporter [Propionibacteriaceae bacterium]|nr:MFS transporter [Propionibacteriaceae bacterium]